MKTLCMDSSHRYLVLGLFEDDKLVAGISQSAWKMQSETLFPELITLMKQANWESEDIEAIVISDGPGSYTGVRIAMSVAKVFCTTMNIPLYRISTLQLYAGTCKHTLTLLDARSNRAYVGFINEGSFESAASIMTLDEIKELIKNKDYYLVGDINLIDQEVKEIDFLKNFIDLKDQWEKVDNIHTMVPFYLKDQSAYKVK
ncbi:MAG: tRNA (adenosine(37)-N6)-threonylcarbamoyltransferase complex dimerization subunit type 1 TsaB [Erysipelotrichaceae bacterium]